MEQTLEAEVAALTFQHADGETYSAQDRSTAVRMCPYLAELAMQKDGQEKVELVLEIAALGKQKIAEKTEESIEDSEKLETAKVKIVKVDTSNHIKNTVPEKVVRETKPIIFDEIEIRQPSDLGQKTITPANANNSVQLRLPAEAVVSPLLDADSETIGEAPKAEIAEEPEIITTASKPADHEATPPPSPTEDYFDKTTVANDEATFVNKSTISLDTVELESEFAKSIEPAGAEELFTESPTKVPVDPYSEGTSRFEVDEDFILAIPEIHNPQAEDYETEAVALLPELSWPVKNVERTIIEMTERIARLEADTAEEVYEILDEIIVKIEGSRTLTNFETEDNTENELAEEVEEKLEDLIVQLFEKCQIEYTPELVRSCAGLLLAEDIPQVALVNSSKETTQDLIDKGTHEVLRQLIVGIRRFKQVITNIYYLGKSALQLYYFQPATD